MKQLLIVVLFVATFVSCGRKEANQPTSPVESRAFELERENFFSSLKNLDDVSRMAQGTISFNVDFLNDPERFFQYNSSKVNAAANLGVYISDLNYCILFKKNEEARKYFHAAYELSKSIEVDKSILEFLKVRYEKNIEQNDSVKLVINQLLGQSTAGLKGTDRERLAGIAMAGYQIENLHLALATLSSQPDVLTDEQAQTQKQLMQYILEQRENFEIIYNFVRVNSDPADPDKNPNYPFFDNALRELIVVYRDVTEIDSQFKELQEKVDALRNKIVTL